MKNKWKLVSREGTKSACFSEGEDFTISFEKELKHVFGYGACNKYYGKYEFIGDTSVEIKLDMTTSQTFDCDNIVWETPFFEALNGLSDYKLEDKQLTFYRDEKEILVFDIYIPESPALESAEIKKEPKPKPEKIKPDDYYGTFKGMLPCADCPGIDVTIVLNPDHTFNETREYIDRNSRFVQDGTY